MSIPEALRLVDFVRGERNVLTLAIACVVLLGWWVPANGMPPCIRGVDETAEVRIPDRDWQPDDARAHDLLDKAFQAAERQQWRMAVKLVEKAMTLDSDTDPGNKDYYGLRARCQEELGNDGPSRASELYSKGVVAERAGQHDLARLLYDEALTEDPEMLWAANNRSWLDSTITDAETETDGASLSYAIYACTKSGWRNWSFLDTLGAALAREGRFGEAEACAERAQELAPAEQQAELAAAVVGYRRGELRRDPDAEVQRLTASDAADSDEPFGPIRDGSPTIFCELTRKQLLEMMLHEGYSAEPLNMGAVSWKLDGFKAQVFISDDGDSLQFHSSFRDDDADLEVVNEWNQRFRYSRSYLDEDGDPHLELDLDLAGGVTAERIFDFLVTCRLSFDAWIKTVVDR